MKDKDLQQLLDEVAGRLGVVGAQLGVYHDGVQREFATGQRNRELGLSVTTDTLFQIGSTTKVFTAALVMSLVDAGKLDLDTPVCQYIEDLRLADTDAQQRMTLRHLLSMSSGLDNGTYHDYGRGDDALGRYVQALAGLPQIFAPGAAFGYSNASTNVAGHAAARVLGQTWERALTDRILAPLELASTKLLAEDLLLHPVALGYYKPEPEAQLQRTPVGILRSMGPSGAMTYSTAGNLLALARMFLDSGRSLQGTPVLSAAAIETMQQPQVKLPTRLFADEWCVGAYRKQWGNDVLHGHSGTTGSGSSMLLWCPARRVAIATTVNVANQGYPLADRIFDVVFPNLFGIPKPGSLAPPPAPGVRVDHDVYVGRFEAHAMTLDVTSKDGKLMLDGSIWSNPVTDCELIPLGESRFLPRDPTVSGNRNWDVAFWGRDSRGRTTHFLQGVFPLRRTG
jgi:CubicO group peptidase (beta-lactamase class C family)